MIPSATHSTMLHHAASLASRGWAIFPLSGKVPAIKDGRGCLDATSDAAQVADWWREYPHAGIGLATGKASGVWVLDIDTKPPSPRKSEASTIDGMAGLMALEMEHGALPSTLTSITGSGGRHYFWRLPAGVDVRNTQGVRTPEGIRSGIDVRGSGGYVVVPPSPHPSGQMYRWGDSPGHIADAPQWLMDIVTRKASPVRTAAPVIPAAPVGDRRRMYGAKVLQSSCDLVVQSAEGGRHDQLLRAARYIGGHVASGFIAEHEARECLIDAGMASGKRRPEVERTVNDGIEDGKRAPIDPSQRPGWDSQKRSAGGQNSRSGGADAPDVSAVAESDAPDLRPVEPRDGLDAFAPPQRPRTGDDLPELVPDSGAVMLRGDEAELSGILHDHYLGPWVCHTNGSMWQYRPERRGWVRLTDEEMMTWVADLAGALIWRGRKDSGEPKLSPLAVSAARARGAVRMAGARVHHDEDDGDYWRLSATDDKAHGIAQFTDRAVMVTQELPGQLCISVVDPHPDLRVRAQRVLPCAWVGLQEMARLESQCPALWRIHREWWSHHGDDEAAARLVAVLEFLGATVLGMAPMMARALFLFGAGGTGKSSLLELLTRWCQPRAVSGVTPQDMGGNRFATARLDGAVVNVVDDLSSDPIRDTGAWKSAVTGGRIDVERKGQDGYGIHPQAGHIYAGNRLPVAIRPNSGFWRRWLVIPYDRVFSRSADARPIVPELLSEMDRIIAFAVTAFLATGGSGGRGYTEPLGHAQIMAEWDRVSDSVSAFAADHLRQPPALEPKSRWPRRSQVYREYRTYCLRTGRQAVSAEEFTNRARDLGHDIVRMSGIWRVKCEVRDMDQEST